MISKKSSADSGKVLVWLLQVVLVGLLLIPIISIGMAYKKTDFTALIKKRPSSSVNTATEGNADSSGGPDLSGLRSVVEKAANKSLKNPKLNPKMKQIQIQIPETKIPMASESVRSVLRQKNLQFVEASEPNKIRIIVILQSKDWVALSSQLELAAEKDGYVYRGPSRTGNSGDVADSMVAEIDILRKPSGLAAPGSTPAATPKPSPTPAKKKA